MSENETINLATVGTAELEAMSTQVFSACLDTMSAESIVRFQRMRKLTPSHRSALDVYVAANPEKRGGHAPAPAATKPAKEAKAPKAAKAKKTKVSKNARAATPPKGVTPVGVDRRSPFPDFKKRLRAWWVGVSLDDLDAFDRNGGKTASVSPSANGDKTTTSDKAQAAKNTPAEYTHVSRAELLQMLWGEGYALPGGEAFTEKLMEGLVFPGDHPCLYLTAGLGGAARWICGYHNIPVEAIEADPELAAAGHELSIAAGMKDAAPVICEDATLKTFPDQTYTAIVAREMMFTVADRKKLLANLVPALRKQGTIVLTDFMLADRSTGNAEMKAWREAEPVRALPYTVEEYSELLDENKFAVKSCDDLSDQYIGFIQAGWQRLHTYLQTAKLSPESATMLMDEGNLWLARCKALQSGQLRLINIRAGLRPVRSMTDAMSIE